VLDHGHKRKQRLALRLMRLAGRTEPDPVAKTSLYRPELFGRPWLRFAHSVMRGPSDWSASERELPVIAVGGDPVGGGDQCRKRLLRPAARADAGG
jgi:hypothetical protein